MFKTLILLASLTSLSLGEKAWCSCGSFSEGTIDYQIIDNGQENACCTSEAYDYGYSNSWEYNEGAWILVSQEPINSFDGQTYCCNPV